MPSYGMAEATLALSFHPHGKPLLIDRVRPAAIKQRKATPATRNEDSVDLVSCGRAFPGHALEIMDEHGRALPEREIGEVLRAWSSVSAGYYGRSGSYAPRFPRRIGYGLGISVTSRMGNLYLCGRIKDLIIIRGANFYPQDIEWSVTHIPGVRRDNVVAIQRARAR